MRSNNVSVPLPVVVLGACALFLSLSVHLLAILSSRPNFLPLLEVAADVRAADTNAFASPTEEVEFPMKLPQVALVTKQSENLGLNSTFDTQWSNLTPKRTMGFVFHPTTKKFYSVAFYHQIHCLNALRKYVARGQQTCSPHTLRTC